MPEYPYEIIKASESALLQLGLELKQYHEDIVLTGGWAPYYIVGDKFRHCGSQDIDLALKTRIIRKYDTIRKILEGLGYVAEGPYQFSRYTKSPIDGVLYPIHLDLLCEEKDTKHINRLYKVQEHLQAAVFEGVSLAFDFNFEQPIEGILPDNGVAKTTFKVTDLVSSITLKGSALKTRNKGKDSYDIFALTHYNGGPTKAAEYFEQTISEKKISSTNQEFLKNSLLNISESFENENQRGPFNVETYTVNKYSRNVVTAQVNQFLKEIKLKFI